MTLPPASGQVLDGGEEVSTTHSDETEEAPREVLPASGSSWGWLRASLPHAIDASCDDCKACKDSRAQSLSAAAGVAKDSADISAGEWEVRSAAGRKVDWEDDDEEEENEEEEEEEEALGSTPLLFALVVLEDSVGECNAAEDDTLSEDDEAVEAVLFAEAEAARALSAAALLAASLLLCLASITESSSAEKSARLRNSSFHLPDDEEEEEAEDDEWSGRSPFS